MAVLENKYIHKNNRKQSIYLPEKKCLNKLQYVCTMNYYRAYPKHDMCLCMAIGVIDKRSIIFPKWKKYML